MKKLDMPKLTVGSLIILLLLFSYTSGQGLAAQNKEQGSIDKAEYSKKYNFSNDWFTKVIPIWKEVLSRFKGKPDIHYLEIGVYEGRSLIWMLENILTHSTSKATGIDTFPRDLKDKFFGNLEISGVGDKVTAITGKSQIKLRRLPLNSYDIIYIDGSHTADDTLADAVLSWPLLKVDGVLIFDDYSFRPHYPLELRPKIAIDAFITAHRNHLEVVHHGGRQVVLRKQRISHKFSIPIGQYVYFWRRKKLYYPGKSKPIELSDLETALIKRLIKSRRFGETKFSPDNKMLENDNFINLIKRLELDF